MHRAKIEMFDGPGYNPHACINFTPGGRLCKKFWNAHRPAKVNNFCFEIKKTDYHMMKLFDLIKMVDELPLSPESMPFADFLTT